MPFSKIPYEWLIGWRYTRTGKQDRFVSFVTLMSALGIALGVAALIVVLSVMGGFHQELRSRILSVASHLEVIAHDEKGFANWQEVANTFLEDAQVTAVAPLVNQQALLANQQQAVGVFVRGVDPLAEQDVGALVERVNDGGGLDALQPGSFAMLAGERLARQLRAAVGDSVILISPQGALTAGGWTPRMRRVHLAGTFATGLYQYDTGVAFMHIDDVQAIYRLRGATSIRLQLADVLAAPQVRDRLAPLRDDVRIYDWTTSHGGLFQAVQLERRVMFIILTMIIAVASFNIVSALVTMVRGKRGNIAILRAMGATRGAIARIFLCQGMLIGSIGTALGLLLGIPLALSVSEIVRWLEGISGQTLFPGSVYHLTTLPSIVETGDVLAVAAVALLLSLLATAYPAWYASRLAPSDSLRYE